MSQYERLMARDGHTFTAYIAPAAGPVRGAIVVLQEIFGLTAHVLAMADRFAADGYLAIAPALFDRVRRDLVLGYSAEDIRAARGYRQQIETERTLLDIAAATAIVRHAGRVGVVGHCWGGRLAWVAAASLPLAAAVCYYGGGIVNELPRVPACPTLLHFGAQDASIPLHEIDELRAAFPQGTYCLYEAGHAFANADRPAVYNEPAAALALARTRTFLAEHLG